jgi:hypothetical protein
VHAPLVRKIDRAEPAGHAGDGRGEEDHDPQRDRGTVDDLEMVTKLVRDHVLLTLLVVPAIPGRYFVP